MRGKTTQRSLDLLISRGWSREEPRDAAGELHEARDGGRRRGRGTIRRIDQKKSQTKKKIIVSVPKIKPTVYGGWDFDHVRFGRFADGVYVYTKLNGQRRPGTKGYI